MKKGGMIMRDGWIGTASVMMWVRDMVHQRERRGVMKKFFIFPFISHIYKSLLKIICLVHQGKVTHRKKGCQKSRAYQAEGERGGEGKLE